MAKSWKEANVGDGRRRPPAQADVLEASSRRGCEGAYATENIIIMAEDEATASAAAIEGEDEEARPTSEEYESDMGTMFILDLMKQRREKVLRLKKDELINEMARKQKEKMAQAKEATYHTYAGGGFVGVQKLMENPPPKRFHWKKREERTAQ